MAAVAKKKRRGGGRGATHAGSGRGEGVDSGLHQLGLSVVTSSAHSLPYLQLLLRRLVSEEESKKRSTGQLGLWKKIKWTQHPIESEAGRDCSQQEKVSLLSSYREAGYPSVALLI